MVPNLNQEPAETAADRKRDHIEMAFEAQTAGDQLDDRFTYEPVLAAHPEPMPPFVFLNKNMKAPIWISSMTGGTSKAGQINRQLARVAKDYGLGMGLGSCRRLLFENDTLADFAVRKEIGDQPFYANLGIAQIEQLHHSHKQHLIHDLINKLEADGLIVHINPLQEWLQPEGDRFEQSPIVILRKLLDWFPFPVIVKEVGQGMGYESVKTLMELPIAALEFGAFGGTNFALLEMMRGDAVKMEAFRALERVGHTAEEMVRFVNDAMTELGSKRQCNQVIVSGGIRSFLDGHYYLQRLSLPAIYGQASPFLKYALGPYEVLQQFVEYQIAGLQFARSYLKLRT
ncbi:MAG TPA: isopentenyl-diphosphate delta-isomerase [Saprospiraceae bacterium]|nr:isopentenyl-diphosphate delta-isomerase [Saprospiraceae bacterium]HPG05965.1 isopentenyl-diphosphate delta-isomerase [Saprospiraceae bacterium]HQU51881.1 isopentenyl-diphosphate delta-isomerase [Saprospiraceae bacterium]HRV83493.1 isopentenyl-diphosphate delta-isomerase [Saprospiraceae bacterium]